MSSAKETCWTRWISFGAPYPEWLNFFWFFTPEKSSRSFSSGLIDAFHVHI
ncbi:hypothetical protein SCH4B_0081 [Ruegeria sp. TrichCH4B]|nr:hypothetical protein SCH4B_0081 [Ruegeria sp. TrichCH4B]